jgi:hypothetical protein
MLYRLGKVIFLCGLLAGAFFFAVAGTAFMAHRGMTEPFAYILAAIGIACVAFGAAVKYVIGPPNT